MEKWEVLKLGEEAYQLQEELDLKLREAYVSLSSARTVAGRSVNFGSVTWPTTREATTVLATQSGTPLATRVSNGEGEKEGKRVLQQWCGHSAAGEATKAQREFSQALALCLRFFRQLPRENIIMSDEQQEANKKEEEVVVEDEDAGKEEVVVEETKDEVAPPEPKKTRIAKELPAEYTELDWPELAKQGLVEKQKLPMLKAFCKQNGLAMTGNKPDFIARVLAHLGGEEAAAPAE
ncbi:hypothetical protein BASA81_004758 [Batrachochytrium salamandrivorans]|nr:hypothetical protein BASA81_004758 [Batrachochytrium salamandrivorans]